MDSKRPLSALEAAMIGAVTGREAETSAGHEALAADRAALDSEMSAKREQRAEREQLRGFSFVFPQSEFETCIGIPRNS